MFLLPRARENPSSPSLCFQFQTAHRVSLQMWLCVSSVKQEIMGIPTVGKCSGLNEASHPFTPYL